MFFTILTHNVKIGTRKDGENLNAHKSQKASCCSTFTRTLWGWWVDLQEENRKVIEGDEALAWMASVERVCLNYYFIIIVATESRFVERVANFRINTHATSSAISS